MGELLGTFLAFDPHKDIIVGQFVALCSPPEDRVPGAIFYITKVRALEQAATLGRTMTVIWYWPKTCRGATDAPGQHHQRYTNCALRMWEPSKEADDTIAVSSTMTSWTNPNRHTPMCYVHGVWVEKKIKILDVEVHHIQLHLNA